jgi:hypothetical protein
MKKAKSKKPRKIAGKSEAARSTVHKGDFRLLLGIGTRVPMNPNPKFTTEDQLWEKDDD